MGRAASWIGAGAAAILCAAAAATTVATVAIVLRLHVPLPYWDEWFTVDHFRRFAEGRYGVLNLAEQHNEHRLLFPRIAFFVDAFLFRLSGLFDLWVTLLLQGANAALLIAVMLRRVSRPVHRLLLGGFVVLLLFSLRQEQNFTNGFQLQFVGVFTAGLLAVLAYGAALERLGTGRRGAAPRFAAAALWCAVSAYTMANGLTAGFVLAVMALLAGARPRVPLATAALSGLLALLFFQRYVPGGAGLPLSQVPSHLWAYPRFVTAYLGDPIGSSIRSTQALGLLGLLLLAGAAWRVARGPRDPSGLALVGIAGFVLATVIVTAYGRVALGTEQAFESRYATPALIFWCAVVIFWWPVAVRSAAPALALCAVMALLAAASCWFEATAWPDLAARSAALRRVSDSLLAGLYDGDAASAYETTEASKIAGFVPFLRAERLSVFADPDYPALGRPVGPASPPGACDGAVVTAAADPALGPDGVRLSGRAVDDRLHRAPRRILLADAAGTVVGFGSASLPGEPSRQWTGYARAAGGATLRAYARLGDGTPCDIGSATVAAADGR